MLVAIAVAIVLVYLVYLSNRLEDTNAKQRTSALIVSYTLAIELRTVDMETAQRGYVLTGQKSFLEPYTTGVDRIRTTGIALRRFVAHDPSQRRRVDAALSDVHDYIHDFAGPNIALVATDHDAASTRIASREGKARVDEIRSVLTKIVTIERTRRDALASQAEHLAARAKMTSSLAIAGLLIVLGMFVGFINSVVVRPLRELRDVVVRIAGGDLSVRPPRRYRGEAEELAQSVTKMTVELQQAQSTLEQRAREIEEHATALERSNTDLEQFAYAAAHDLQEPLRMVASYTGLIERRYKGQLDDDADEFIRYAVDGAKRMQRLINDLLTYSRVNSTSAAASDVSVQEAAHEALENLTARIEERAVEVELDIAEELYVHAQRGQLVMLLQNLVGNALRFADAQTPHVSVTMHAEAGNIIGHVDDDGNGIEPQYREKVFRIFQRLGARDEHAGTGIGLALCRRIVERHGGEIHVEEAPIGGARFTFVLPAVDVTDRRAHLPVMELQ